MPSLKTSERLARDKRETRERLEEELERDNRIFPARLKMKKIKKLKKYKKIKKYLKNNKKIKK